MSAFIFVSGEGYTFQPGSESDVPDVENLQVLVFAEGNNSQEAFANLLADDEWISDTTFDEVTCYELKDEDYQRHSSRFSIHGSLWTARKRNS